MRLDGKVCVVTGGAQGIGRAYCLRFAAEGAAVAVLDLRESQAREVADEISMSGGRALAITADVRSETSMGKAAHQVAEELGRIDVLVNNAALYYDIDHTDQSVAYLHEVLDVNLVGTIISARAVFPQMKRQRSGSIINISSTAAYLFPEPHPEAQELETIPISGYGLSKWGVIYLTKFMAQSLGRYKIRVNAIAPGLTLSEATRHQKGIAEGPAPEALTRATALGEALDPEDLGGIATFLASDDSARMTGQTLVIDAGRIMLG